MASWRVWQWFRRLFRAEERRPKPPSGGRTSVGGQTGGPSMAGTVRSTATPAGTSPPASAGAPPSLGKSVGETAQARPAQSVEQAARAAARPTAIEPSRARPASRSARRDTLDLVIGLDFGTAATKVVIRSPYLPGQRAAAVKFGELGHSASPYLLPSRLRVGSDGHLSIRGDKPGEWLTDLKLPLLDRPLSGGDASNMGERLRGAAAYLALTLREARTRFMTAERETYGRFEPRWALNLGIPSAGYDDDAIRGRFLRAARTAWALSYEAEALTWDSIAQALNQERQPTFDAGIAIDVVPEVAAKQSATLARHSATQAFTCSSTWALRHSTSVASYFTSAMDRIGMNFSQRLWTGWERWNCIGGASQSSNARVKLIATAAGHMIH